MHVIPSFVTFLIFYVDRSLAHCQSSLQDNIRVGIPAIDTFQI